MLLHLYASVGLDTLVSDPMTLNQIIGVFEIGLGLLVLARPTTGILLAVLG